MILWVASRFRLPVASNFVQLSGIELRHDASEELVNVEILGHFKDCSNCLNLLLLAYIYRLCKFGDVRRVKWR